MPETNDSEGSTGAPSDFPINFPDESTGFRNSVLGRIVRWESIYLSEEYVAHIIKVREQAMWETSVKKVTIISPETTVDFQQTSWCYIQKICLLNHCENPETYKSVHLVHIDTFIKWTRSTWKLQATAFNLKTEENVRGKS
jgi:hypothetical protein